MMGTTDISIYPQTPAKQWQVGGIAGSVHTWLAQLFCFAYKVYLSSVFNAAHRHRRIFRLKSDLAVHPWVAYNPVRAASPATVIRALLHWHFVQAGLCSTATVPGLNRRI